MDEKLTNEESNNLNLWMVNIKCKNFIDYRKRFYLGFTQYNILFYFET
jgi:hypothetical protein